MKSSYQALFFLSLLSSCSSSAAATSSGLEDSSKAASSSIHLPLLPLDTTPSSPDRGGRSLATEDWEDFRDVFKEATIKIPDFDAKQEVAWIDFVMRATNILCFDIMLGDMTIDYEKVSSQRLNFGLEVIDIDLKCTMDFSWSYGRIGQGGSATVRAEDNSANAQFSFSSVDFAAHPPTSSKVESCVVNIDVTDLSFSGSMSANLLNIFEKRLSAYIEDEIESLAKEELGSLGTTMVEDFMKTADELLEPYLQQLPPEQTDPLFLENTMDVGKDVRLMNFKDEDSDNAWFTDALKEVDAALGVPLYDANSPYDDGKDLGINIFLRDQLLTEDRALEFTIDDLPFDVDPTIFSGHDMLTETVMTLQMVKVYGLDTFTHFAPLSQLGNYTLKTDLKWEYLLFEFDINLEIKGSTKDDSVFETRDGVSDMITENIQVYFGADDIEASISLLLAIDEAKFGALSIGSLLRSENMLPCFWSSLFKTELTELNAAVGNIREPELRGFISKGVDDIVTNSVEAAFLMYESVVIEAIPNIFQTDLKKIVNDAFFLSYSQTCEQPTSSDQFVDFRDLLMDKESSSNLGGSGLEPYGDMASKLAGFAKQQLTTVEADGTLSANSMFIRPLTEKQSGVEGTIHFPDELYRFVEEEIDLEGLGDMFKSFMFSVGDLKIQNIDSLMPPVEILKPGTDSASLNNAVSLGPMPNRPLKIGGHIVLDLQGDASVTMHNEMDISVTANSFELITQLSALMYTENFLEFPVSDLLNVNCWLALIPPPELDEAGVRLPESSLGLQMKSILTTIQDFAVQATCSSCDSPGLSLLTELMEILRFTGVTEVVSDRADLFVQEFVRSDKMQKVFDRMLHSARVNCPQYPEFNGEEVYDLYDSFGKLSKQTIDSLELVTAIGFEVALVLFSETQRLQPILDTDPLAGQMALDVPEDVTLVNFMDFNIEVGPLADMGLDQLRQELGGTFIDTETGEEILGINDFINKNFGEGGVMNLVFDDMEIGNENFILRLNSIEFTGLDSFTEFNILDAIGTQTFQNKIQMESMGFTVNFTVGEISEPRDVTFSVDFEGLNLTMPFLAAFDMELLTSLKLGSLLFSEEIVPCLLSTLRNFSLPQFIVNVDHVSTPKIEGLSEETNAVVTNLFQYIWTFYNDNIRDAIPSIFDNVVKGLLNNMANVYVDNQSKCANKMLNATSSSMRRLDHEEGFVDFRDLLLSQEMALQYGGKGTAPYGDIAYLGMSMLKDKVLYMDPNTGLSAVNKNVIAPLTGAVSGEDGNILIGEVINSEAEVNLAGLNAGLAFRISEVTIENIDTVGEPFSLLDTTVGQPFLLENEATIGVGERPLTLKARLTIKVETEDEQISNDLYFSFSVHGASVFLTTILKLSEARVAEFPIGDILNLDCWLATIPSPELDAFGVRWDGQDLSAALNELVASVAQLNLNVDCIDCSSPGLEEWAILLSNPEISEDLTKELNDYLVYMSNLLGGGFMQIQIDRMLNEAAMRCPHSASYDEKFISSEFLAFETDEEEAQGFPVILIVGAATAAIIVLLICLVLALRCLVRRRHKKWLRSLPNQKVFRMKRQQDIEQRRESSLNEMTKSMFTSETIPLALRLVMPLIIVGNIGLFLSGHLSLAATVDVEANFAGQILRVGKFYEFSMVQSTMEIWQAGGKQLAILIFFFSGVWPYTKQVITLLLWFLPPSWCSISVRGSTLLWLDTLAKWSMIDIFVMIVSVAGFRVSIQSPEVSYLPQDFYSIDLMVVPLWGLYANMIAQLISQLSSHFIIYYHRRIVNKGMKMYVGRHGQQVSTEGSSPAAAETALGDPASSQLQWNPYGTDEHEKLCNHAFSRPHRGEADKLILKPYVNVMLVVGALCLCVFIVAGCSAPSVALEFFGLVGVAVESGQEFDQAITHYNMFGMTGILMDQGRFLDSATEKLGLGSLSALIVLTVLLVPLLQTLTLLVHWFVPMAGRTRTRLSVFLEILQAWQYAEVYIIALFVASWQLGPISEWMINAYCQGLSETFSNLVYYGLISESDGQCFQVEATVEFAAYLLAGGAALLALLNTFVMNATKQYFRDCQVEQERVLSGLRRKQEGALAAAKREWDSTTTFKMVDGDDAPASVIDGHEVASLDIGEDMMSWDEADNRAEAERKIHPVPVLFTDKFRWTLDREIPMLKIHSRQQLAAVRDDMPLLSSNGVHITSQVETAHSQDSQSNLIGVEIEDSNSIAVSCIVDDASSVGNASKALKGELTDNENDADVESVSVEGRNQGQEVPLLEMKNASIDMEASSREGSI